MKKTHAGLLFAVMATGLIFAGCQKPAEAPATDEAVTGTIKIEPAGETAAVNGSITIEMPEEKQVNGSVSIVPAEGTAAPANGVVAPPVVVEPAEKAMEEAATLGN
jgi:hypothetical protein